MNPRTLLSNFPQEVYCEWIEPEVNSRGWPFESIDDDVSETEWKYVFGLDTSLRDISSRIWEQESIDLQKAKFELGTMQSISSIIESAVSGERSNIERSAERYKSCLEYVSTHRNVPKPIILIENGGLYMLADGNHRCAAAISAQIYVITAWVAKMPNK